MQDLEIVNGNMNSISNEINDRIESMLVDAAVAREELRTLIQDSGSSVGQAEARAEIVAEAGSDSPKRSTSSVTIAPSETLQQLNSLSQRVEDLDAGHQSSLSDLSASVFQHINERIESMLVDVAVAREELRTLIQDSASLAAQGGEANSEAALR